MALKKELFIGSSKLVEFDDKTSIPTTLLFSPGTSKFGYQAIAAAQDPSLLNNNFKLELGKVIKGRLNPPLFETADGQLRSAPEITRVFVEQLLKRTDHWIDTNGLKRADRILVAEPLDLDKSDLVHQEWLPSYRYHLKAILSTRFAEVDFLPEPFAVFQYYRYGVKHPLVASANKHVALVLDFGGGTFDVSVVETTLNGDVSASGHNSRPLSAASIPVGGHYINREIAKKLLNANVQKGVDKSMIGKAWKTFEDYEAKGSVDSGILREDLKQFIKNIKRFLAEIEEAKISICNLINNWEIDAEFTSGPAVQIQVPTSPLSANPGLASVRFDAYQLREIFVERIWKNRIKVVICDAIKRAEAELKNQQITVVLLSGGASNIRWLGQLINDELRGQLGHAELLELQENFQEVVAKGLAIECARRTYNEGVGDFQSVTYNRLCLVLAPDGQHPKAFNYKAVDPDVSPGKFDAGVLLPSASTLVKYIDRPLKWRVTLPSPPKRDLAYYFLKSSLDFEDIKSLHNVDTKVHTPANTSFDPSIQIELTIREDGTAIPKFIYRQGWDTVKPIFVEGKPFHMSMTDATPTSLGQAYIGFDFGSSNSSMSYVEQSAVKLFTQRSGEKNWLDIHELVTELPYPVSNPLARFLTATTNEEMARSFSSAFEAMLLFIGYVCYSEYCTLKNIKETKIFKGFTKASAGPLWDLCKRLLSEHSKGSFSKAYGKLQESKNVQIIDDSISYINDLKHHREPTLIDLHQPLNLLGNIILVAMKNHRLGTFEGISKIPFSEKYRGIFRSATGSHAPFVEAFEYKGDSSYAEQEVFIVDLETGMVLGLAPLMFWLPRSSSTDTNLAIFDCFNGGCANYRTVMNGPGIQASGSDLLCALQEMFNSQAQSDPKRTVLPRGEFVARKSTWNS